MWTLLRSSTEARCDSPKVSGKDYPRLQILSIRELLDEGRKPQLPLLILPTYQRAERVQAKAAEQAELFGDHLA